MLAARTRRAEHLHLVIIRLDLEITGIIRDIRDDLDRGKRGVTAAGGIKRRNTHQTVHARLTLEEAVGVFALDDDIGGLEAGLFAVLIVHDLIGKAVALGPPGIHAVQHLAPVLRFSAARARVEGNQRVVFIVLAGQQGGKLLLGHTFLQFLITGLQLFEHGFVVLFDRHFADGEQIFAQAVHFFIGFDLALECAHPRHDLLAFIRIVPKSGLGGLELKLLDLAPRALESERLVQLLQLGLQVVQFDLVFLELQHGNAPSRIFQYLIVYRLVGKM